MNINGADIADEELAEITEFVKPHAEAMAGHPTEFELVSAIAMEYFAGTGATSWFWRWAWEGNWTPPT